MEEEWLISQMSDLILIPLPASVMKTLEWVYTSEMQVLQAIYLFLVALHGLVQLLFVFQLITGTSDYMGLKYN